MSTTANLYSIKNGEIKKFLNSYFKENINLENDLFWSKTFQNPIEIADIIAAYSDNFEKFDFALWISLDKDIFIKISEHNSNPIIKYLFERFPY